MVKWSLMNGQLMDNEWLTGWLMKVNWLVVGSEFGAVKGVSMAVP